MKAKMARLDSVVSLDRPSVVPDLPPSYPRLWVDKRSGDIRMGPAPDQPGGDDPEGSSVDYRVELDVYNGPLDLLLYLIKRDELEIHDIPITRITQTYLEYVTALRSLSKQGLDINVAGDFLVMAATLMEIKSAMLLPRAVVEPGEEGNSAAAELSDPRYELVQKLLEYKRFKDAANALDHQHDVHRQRFPRFPAKAIGAADEPPPVDLEEVQIWDLLQAFTAMMSEVGNRRPFHEVVYDDTPIDLHAADIEDRLKREDHLTLRQLLVGRKSRSEMVGVFLALLELIRQKRILVQQEEVTSELEIVAAPEEHRKTYAHASLHLADDSEQPAGSDVPAVPATAEPAENEAAGA